LRLWVTTFVVIFGQLSFGQMTISDFNGTGFNYTFAGFNQTAGSNSVRLRDPSDAWGGAGLNLGVMDFSPFANGRFSVDMTVNPNNAANSFELELIDTNNNTGKWTFGVNTTTPGVATNFVSRSVLNDPDYGVGDWQNLDLSNIRTFQVLGEFDGPGQFDMNFDNILVSNNLEEPPPYPGHEPNAPWRAVADQRIEANRKADVTVRVFDAGGKRLPDANVHVAMQEHEFGFGSAVVGFRLRDNNATHAAYKQKVEELFNIATLENNLKWPPWEGEWGGLYSQQGAVSALNWLQSKSIEARGHVMVWPGRNNLPSDLKALLDTAPLNASEQQLIRDRIQGHIDSLTSRTNGRIEHWDVLNEPRSNNDLMQVLAEGDDAMVDWFQYADGATQASLYINEFDILASAGGTSTAKQDLYFDTIEFLKNSGAPIDGVGFQGHFTEGNITGPEQLWTILDRFEQLGLDMQVTEFDFSTTDEQLQADFTYDFLKAMFAHEGVDDVLFWGFWENAHWRPEAALYRDDWSIKPNGEAYNELVFNEWWTDEVLNSDEFGEATLRAFKGKHQVDVEFGQVSESLVIQLTEGGLERNVVLPLLLGDYNMNGTVDAADFTVWRDNLGSTSNLAADGNNNGVVDPADFQIWIDNFGRTADLVLNIPEPSALSMMLVALMALSGFRRSKTDSVGTR
ncbi:MAG: endo-1,4-beta-xylanase, partial [Planctomycetota bacterium]